MLLDQIFLDPQSQLDHFCEYYNLCLNFERPLLVCLSYQPLLITIFCQGRWILLLEFQELEAGNVRDFVVLLG